MIVFLACCGSALAGQPQGPDGGAVDEERLFQVVGAMYQIDPDLLAAIARVESDGRPDARSPRGAEGLMQLTASTARLFQVDNPYDPVQSALGAARFLRFLEKHQAMAFETVCLTEVIAAYNAGEGAVERYRGIPPYPETRQYVRDVLWFYLTGSVPVSQPAKVTRAAPSARHGRSGDRDAVAQLAEIRRSRENADFAPQSRLSAHGEDH